MTRRNRFLFAGAAGIMVVAAAAAWMMRVPPGPVIPTGAVPRATGWETITVLTGLEHPRIVDAPNAPRADGRDWSETYRKQARVA